MITYEERTLCSFCGSCYETNYDVCNFCEDSGYIRCDDINRTLDDCLNCNSPCSHLEYLMSSRRQSGVYD
jgi:hypothetical protein